ncbi:hypothetical protein G6011_06516 [Alternaria panax]|uniref:Uncharacterized protein n=1 Tax=Alternaria panax TaxID=48097 RepID=A0AAD4FIL1_9PLEO|nr:hypothetical protein G6011_06516 [Alternaria panax]
MVATNLIIALVFAGIFGAALIYVALWFIHRYIHQGCYELEYWLYSLFSNQLRPPPFVYAEKEEGRESSKHRSRSVRKERERPARSQTRKYYEDRDRESNRVGDADLDWSRPRDVERARPMIQFDTPMKPHQQQSYGQAYYPSLGQEQWPGANRFECFPQMQQQLPMSWQAQGVAHMLPFAVSTALPQQAFPEMAVRMPEPLQYPSLYPPQSLPRGQQYRKSYTETTGSDVPKGSPRRTPLAKPKSPAKRARRVEKVDFIHICDEYPPIVLERLKNAAPPSSSSSSSSSSDTSGTTQEVPRASIPRATAGFADTTPFEFPQCPHTATRAWNTPRLYPRQWSRDTREVDGPDAQARYAPFTPSLALRGLARTSGGDGGRQARETADQERTILEKKKKNMKRERPTRS